MRLANELHVDLKVRLSARLAEMEDAPGEMIRSIAGGEIEYARPVLEKSTALLDSDLIQLIRNASPEHGRVIAGRRHLTSAVTDALIERGESDALRILLSNSSVQLSDIGLETLTRISERDPELARPLLARTDLAPRFAHRMFWWLSSELRGYVLSRYTMDRSVLQQALGAGQGDETEEDFGWPDEVRALIGPPAQPEQRLIDEFCDLYRADRERGLVKLISDICGIVRTTATAILRDEGGEALAVLCKALGVSRQDLSDLMLVARGPERAVMRLTAPAEPILALYDSVSTDRADLTLRYWDAEFRREDRRDSISEA